MTPANPAPGRAIAALVDATMAGTQSASRALDQLNPSLDGDALYTALRAHLPPLDAKQATAVRAFMRHIQKRLEQEANSAFEN